MLQFDALLSLAPGVSKNLSDIMKSFHTIIRHVRRTDGYYFPILNKTDR